MKGDRDERDKDIENRMVPNPIDEFRSEKAEEDHSDDEQSDDKADQSHQNMYPAEDWVPATLKPDEPVTGASAADSAPEKADPPAEITPAVLALRDTSVAMTASPIMAVSTVTTEETSWSDTLNPLQKLASEGSDEIPDDPLTGATAAPRMLEKAFPASVMTVPV